MKGGRSTTRSPIKEATLQNPGESIGTEINELISEDFTIYLVAFVLSAYLAGMEWMRWIFKWPPMPVQFTLAAATACVYTGVKMVRTRKRLRRLKQGMEGEKAVGQYLERLREKGYQVLHDVPGDKFNVDHLVVGQTGVYVIETKTISKPQSKAVIEYDGEQVKVNGFTPDRDPVAQAKALSNWIKELIKESTGRDFPVRPVVLYPGWYITQQPRGAEVWVLNPKGLPAFLDHAEENIPPEDVHLVTYHLCRYVRSRNAKQRAA